MQKWEYKSVYIAIISQDGSSTDKLVEQGYEFRYLWQELLQEELNRYGTYGWELVSIPEKLMEGEASDGFVIFKRLKVG